MMRPIVALCLMWSAFLLAVQPAGAGEPDIRITVDGLALTTIATGLDFPKALALAPDGSLLVGVNPPDGGSFFAANGAVLRWTDHDDDELVDGAPVTLVEGLPGPVVGLAVAGDLVVATTAPYGVGVISFLRRGPSWAAPLTLAGQLTFAMEGREHQSYGLLTRPNPLDPAAWDLFFNIGAAANADAGDPVTMSGLLEGTLPDASLVMVTVHNAGDTITLSPPVVIATGLRNAAALALDPATGDLLITDNGIDGLDDPTEPLSADELEWLPADRIGQTVDYGFPGSYVAYRTGESIGGGEPPLATFQPIDGSEAEGISAIAVMPVSFPPTLAGKAIAGFHGQFDETGAENEENAVRAIDLGSGASFDLIANESEGVGHMDAMVTAGQTVYLADMCVDGSLAGATPCGALYALRVAPPA